MSDQKNQNKANGSKTKIPIPNNDVKKSLNGLGGLRPGGLNNTPKSGGKK